MTLISYSSTDTYYGSLHKHIGSFLTEMQDLTQSFNFRRLIGTRPTEEHGETCIRHHKMINQASIDGYARVLAGLITFIHRVCAETSSTYTFPIDALVKSECDNLVSQLQAPAINEDKYDVFQLQVIDVDTSDCESDFDMDDQEDTPTNHSDIPPPIDQPSSPLQDSLIRLLFLLYTQSPVLPEIEKVLTKLDAHKSNPKTYEGGHGYWDDYCLAQFLKGVRLCYVA